jgi:hypothetical protein
VGQVIHLPLVHLKEVMEAAEVVVDLVIQPAVVEEPLQ